MWDRIEASKILVWAGRVECLPETFKKQIFWLHFQYQDKTIGPFKLHWQQEKPARVLK